MIRTAFLFRVVLTALVLLAPVAISSPAQGRIDDKDVETLMNNLGKDAKTFQSSFNSAIGKSTIRKTTQAKDAKTLVQTFRKQAEGMLQEFKSKKRADQTLPLVSATAAKIDQLLAATPLGPATTSDWAKVKSSLGILSKQFFLSPQVAVASTSTNGINLVIKNYNPTYSNANVYFSFRVAPVQGTINGQPIVAGKVYNLTEIGSGIVLQNFANGRIYFTLGSSLQDGTNDPEPVNPQVVGYNVRFDKLELTYIQGDSSSVANLTSIDYFGIPLAIQTYAANSSTPIQSLTFTTPGNTVISDLAQLTGSNSRVWLKDSSGNFLRVLGPTLSPSGAYPSFAGYINQVRSSGTPFQIEDLYSSAGSTVPTMTQCYNFTSSFDANGDLHLSGGGSSYNGGQSVGPGHEIVILVNDLANGIYSANPPYTVDGAPAKIANNDVYSAAVRDVLAGFGFGFLGSSVVNPKNNKPFNQEPSAYWWLSPHAFSFPQPGLANYDPYANYLFSISQSYGQPFSDRWQTVQAKLDPNSVATMEIDILPDSGAMPVQPNPGPPAPKGLYCVQ